MKIYIDYDSTLNNLCDVWCKWINKKYNVFITKSDIKHFYWVDETFGDDANDFWKNPSIYSKDVIKPLKKAVLFVSEIKEMFGEEKVFILTSSIDEIKESKTDHIVRHFDFDRSKIIHHSKKHEITHDGILIDDHILTVRDHCKYNRNIGIVFNHFGKNGWSRLDLILGEVKPIAKILKVRTSYDDVLKVLKNAKDMW